MKSTFPQKHNQLRQAQSMYLLVSFDLLTFRNYYELPFPQVKTDSEFLDDNNQGSLIVYSTTPMHGKMF